MKSLKIEGAYPQNQYNIDIHGATAVHLFRQRVLSAVSKDLAEEHRRIVREEIRKVRQLQWHSATQLGTGHPQYETIRRKHSMAEHRSRVYGWNRQSAIRLTILHCSAIAAAENFCQRMWHTAHSHTARLSIGEGRFEATTKRMKNGKLRTYYKSNFWSGCHLESEIDGQSKDLFLCSLMTAIDLYRHEYLSKGK